MPEQGPTVFKDRYELHRKLARGGMSDVYLARDQVLDRPVAVKVMFPEYAKDPTFVERFRREAQAAAKLNHPNVVAVYDWGEEMGTYFIAMEYVEGRSLSEIIRAEGPLPPRRVAEITADVAAALGFAHQNGVVHRDVKPGNVIIETSGQVKVADFGIAQALSGGDQAQLTRVGAVMGTATYFSPEQAQGKQVDQRSDLYSLGCVMFEMLATRPPFQGDTPVAIAYKHVQEQPPRLAALGAHVPAPLDAIIVKSLAKDPAQRYQSADELRSDLRRFLAGQPVAAAAAAAVAAGTGATMAVRATSAVPATGQRPPPQEEYYPPRRGSGIFIGMLVLMLIGLAVALVYIGSNLSSKSAKKQVTVPTVVNLPVDQATLLLTTNGFKVDRQDIPNDKFEAGRVYDQDPKGQTEADDGSVVHIMVAAAVGDTEVPTVSNLLQADAEKQLKAAGFNPIVNQESSETVQKGLVISQNPAAGSKVAKGSNVTIVVSTGKLAVELPDVPVGSTPLEAKAILDKAGFKLQAQVFEASSDVTNGKVIRIEPSPGSKADPNSTTVQIVISTGPDVPTTTATTAPPPTSTTTTKPPATTTTTKPPATTTTTVPATTTTV